MHYLAALSPLLIIVAVFIMWRLMGKKARSGHGTKGGKALAVLIGVIALLWGICTGDYLIPVIAVALALGLYWVWTGRLSSTTKKLYLTAAILSTIVGLLVAWKKGHETYEQRIAQKLSEPELEWTGKFRPDPGSLWATCDCKLKWGEKEIEYFEHGVLKTKRVPRVQFIPLTMSTPGDSFTVDMNNRSDGLTSEGTWKWRSEIKGIALSGTISGDALGKDATHAHPFRAVLEGLPDYHMDSPVKKDLPFRFIPDDREYVVRSH